jgi:hypothetical protein
VHERAVSSFADYLWLYVIPPVDKGNAPAMEMLAAAAGMAELLSSAPS